MRRRRATDEDFETAFAIQRQAYREHVERLWGRWDDDWQRTNFRREFQESTCEVVVVDDRAVGFVQYVEEPDSVRIWNVALRPEARGRGLGTLVMLELQSHARAREMELRLRAFTTNDRALRFYLRLGFREISRSQTSIELTWSAAPLGVAD